MVQTQKVPGKLVRRKEIFPSLLWVFNHLFRFSILGLSNVLMVSCIHESFDLRDHALLVDLRVPRIVLVVIHSILIVRLYCREFRDSPSVTNNSALLTSYDLQFHAGCGKEKTKFSERVSAVVILDCPDVGEQYIPSHSPNNIVSDVGEEVVVASPRAREETEDAENSGAFWTWQYGVFTMCKKARGERI